MQDKTRKEKVTIGYGSAMENVKFSLDSHTIYVNIQNMERLFYQELIDWKTGRMGKPLMVVGARQVGKTYLIDAFCQAEYRQYRQVNLFEEPLFQQIYSSDLNSEMKFEQLQLLIGLSLEDPETILFVDEVQESEEFIAELKFIQEKHPLANIVCAGSLLGVKLKRSMKPFPVGKVVIKEMYPMSFQEFLMAIGRQALIPMIQRSFRENEMMLPAMHQQLLQLHRVYLCIGGMPEAVQHYLDAGGDLLQFDRSFFIDLRKAYLNDMNKYVKSQSEAIKVERIYDSIPIQQANQARKFQYSKIRSGARASQYESALDWIIAASLVYKADCVTNTTKPLHYFTDPDIFKLFINDVGMLVQSMGIDSRDIILDQLKQFKGLLAESYVAQELTAAGIDLYYWRSENTAEIDFLIETEDGVVPLEVKSADNVQSKSLDVYRRKFDPPYAIRVSTKNFGFSNGKKSLPLYAVFCLKRD